MDDFQFGVKTACVALVAMGFILGLKVNEENLKFSSANLFGLTLLGLVWYVAMLALYSSVMKTNDMGVGIRPTYSGFAMGSLMMSFVLVIASTGLWAIIFGILKRIVKTARQLRARWEQIQAVR